MAENTHAHTHTFSLSLTRARTTYFLSLLLSLFLFISVIYILSSRKFSFLSLSSLSLSLSLFFSRQIRESLEERNETIRNVNAWRFPWHCSLEPWKEARVLLFLNGVRVALERHEPLRNRINADFDYDDACLREMLGPFTNGNRCNR